MDLQKQEKRNQTEGLCCSGVIFLVLAVVFLFVGILTIKYQQEDVTSWDTSTWSQMYIAAFIMFGVLFANALWVCFALDAIKGNDQERINKEVNCISWLLFAAFVGFVVALVFFGTFASRSHALNECHNSTLSMMEDSDCGSPTHRTLSIFCIVGFVLTGITIFCSCDMRSDKKERLINKSRPKKPKPSSGPSNNINSESTIQNSGTSQPNERKPEEDKKIQKSDGATSNQASLKIETESERNILIAELKRSNELLTSKSKLLQEEIERLKRSIDLYNPNLPSVVQPLPPVTYNSNSGNQQLRSTFHAPRDLGPIRNQGMNNNPNGSTSVFFITPVNQSSPASAPPPYTEFQNFSPKGGSKP